MRQNRTTIFLLSTFAIIIAIFVLKYSENDWESNTEVKNNTRLKYEKEKDWKGAELYLDEQLKENPNCKNDKDLKSELNRIKELNALDNPEQ
jgi:hypothetical protein